MRETELLNKLINEYELNEDLSIDDVFSKMQKTDPQYNNSSKEDRVKLKRAFSYYLNSVDEEISIVKQQQDADVDSAVTLFLTHSESCSTSKMPSRKRRSYKKYVEAFVNNISVPKTLEELYDFYLNGNDAQNLIRDTALTGTTCWTVPRWAKRGDIVLFMHSKTAKSTLTKLRTTLRSESSFSSKESDQLEQAIADQLAFHKQYGGKIFAVGHINGHPEIVDTDPNMHFKSRVFCDIDKLFLLSVPIDISEFNSFIKISRQSSVTPVFGAAYDKLKELITEKNDMPEYFIGSYSTPFPHSLVNNDNWMKLGLEYRISFMLEIQFRQCYVDYLLKELGDQKTVYMECSCYKGKKPVTFVDNIIRINKRLLPVEVKLDIELENDLEGQCEQYCSLDRLVLDKKTEREANRHELIGDKVLIIDTYGVYIFDLQHRKINLLCDLSDLKSVSDVHELRNIIIALL